MPRRRMHYFHGTAGHPPFPRVQGPNHAGLFLGTGDFRAALAAGNRPPERCIGGPTGPGRAVPREVAHPHGTRRVSESARTACNGGAGPRRVVLGAGRRGPGRPRRALPRSRPAGPRRRSRAALEPARRRRPGAEVLDATEGPVPPVGHSCDGAVITEAGDHPVVAHLVFLCADPRPGRVLHQCRGRRLGHGADRLRRPARLRRRRPRRRPGDHHAPHRCHMPLRPW